jgi:hypothetical protein
VLITELSLEEELRLLDPVQEVCKGTDLRMGSEKGSSGELSFSDMMILASISSFLSLCHIS